MPIKKIPVVKITVEGVEVDAKECTMCNVIKPLTDYRNEKRGSGGKKSRCRSCEKTVSTEWQKNNREKAREYVRNSYYRHKKQRIKAKYTWRQVNPEVESIIRNNKRARDVGLPNTLTVDEWRETLGYFDNRCAICGSVDGVEPDHWIPIEVGRGGTTKKNMIPLCSYHNRSKKDDNPNEWIARLDGVSPDKVKRIYEYLATLNGVDTDFYAMYIDGCFANRPE